MQDLIASDAERAIWSRVQSAAADPGLTLTYQYRLRGPIDVAHIDAALRRFLASYFPNALSRFVQSGEMLYKRSSALPASVLRVAEASGVAAGSVQLDHLDGPLFDFELRLAGEARRAPVRELQPPRLRRHLL